MRKTACGECMHEVRLVPTRAKEPKSAHADTGYGCTDVRMYGYGTTPYDQVAATPRACQRRQRG